MYRITHSISNIRNKPFYACDRKRREWYFRLHRPLRLKREFAFHELPSSKYGRGLHDTFMINKTPAYIVPSPVQKHIPHSSKIASKCSLLKNPSRYRRPPTTSGTRTSCPSRPRAPARSRTPSSRQNCSGTIAEQLRKRTS